MHRIYSITSYSNLLGSVSKNCSDSYVVNTAGFEQPLSQLLLYPEWHIQQVGGWYIGDGQPELICYEYLE